MLPPPTKTAALHTPEGGQYSVVVLRHESGHAIVGRPGGFSEAPGLDVGVQADLTWSGPAGQQMIATRIVAADAGADMHTWTLLAVGPSVELDRRAYPRIDLNVPMTIGLVGQWQAVSQCLLVDLSEVGLRARLERRDGEQLSPDVELTLRFTADGVNFNLLGRALRIKGVGAEVDLVDVVVMFDLTPENRALLRSVLAAADEA